MKIKHYDLFAGIGGFSLALDTIFHEQKNEHIFCEWEAFPTAVLKKHWPDATYYGDIADLVADTDNSRCGASTSSILQEDWTEGGKEREYTQHGISRHSITTTDTNNQRLEGGKEAGDISESGENSEQRLGEQALSILTGGFPCQPFSHAGRRNGTSDDRYKWPEMFRVIQNVRPDWVIAENVRGLVTWNDGMVLETVCADLESEGYEVQPLIIPAVAICAPHRRDRVWIVAHAINGGQGRTEQGSDGTSNSISQEHRSEDSTAGESERTTSNWVSYKHAPNSKHQRPICSEYEERPRREEGVPPLETSFSWSQDWREVAFATCYDGVDDGLYKRLYQAIIGSNEYNKISDTETVTTASGFTREGLRTLWEQRAIATPSSYLYQLGLCDTLPDLSCESGQERWHTQEQTAEKMRNLWNEFYAQSHTETQDMQQTLLDDLREIERNEAVVIKKDDKGVWDVWCRVYLPSGKTNNMLKELCERYGVAKEEIEIISASKQRQERLKACGNAIVPQVAMEIFKAIKQS